MIQSEFLSLIYNSTNSKWNGIDIIEETPFGAATSLASIWCLKKFDRPNLGFGAPSSEECSIYLTLQHKDPIHNIQVLIVWLEMKCCSHSI